MIRQKCAKVSLCLVAPLLISASTPSNAVLAATATSQSAAVSSAQVATRATSKYANLGMSTANTYLNVRKSASTSSAVVGKLYKGSVATIISISGKWAKVTSGDVQGYVHTDYLAIGSEAEALFDRYATKIAKVTCTSLRVRKTPSTSATILGSVKSGTTHTVLDESKGWIEITYNGQEGWMSKDYVDISYKFTYAVPVTSSSASTTVTGAKVATYAKKFVGNPYVYGGTSLTNGADCSGFVQSVYKNFNITIPRTTKTQVNVGTKVSTSKMQEGDLVFYATNGVVDHVGLYIGDNKIVHAANAKSGIKISSATYKPIYAVRRILD